MANCRITKAVAMTPPKKSVAPCAVVSAISGRRRAMATAPLAAHPSPPAPRSIGGHIPRSRRRRKSCGERMKMIGSGDERRIRKRSAGRRKCTRRSSPASAIHLPCALGQSLCPVRLLSQELTRPPRLPTPSSPSMLLPTPPRHTPQPHPSRSLVPRLTWLLQQRRHTQRMEVAKRPLRPRKEVPNSRHTPLWWATKCSNSLGSENERGQLYAV